MTIFKVYPHKQGSASAKALANQLEGKVLKHVNSKFRPKLGNVVVNWGSSNIPDYAPATTLNPNVEVATCKLETFRALMNADVSTPRWTVNKDNSLQDAIAFEGWNYPIVCRTKLRGHSGDGIVIANTPEELVPAPLYTEYIKKQDEYRIHVVGDKVAYAQRKALKNGWENPNWQIRNLASGFVFVDTELEDIPKMALEEAVKAVQALSLDFGGVDVIWNAYKATAYVLEINTACGLEERSAQRYALAIREYVREKA